MFTVTITEKGGEHKRMEFDKTEITVGRIQGNDIILPKGNVSKRHSRLVLKDGKFIIVDLKSTNGTYVNGRKITSPLVVKGSDKIYIGDYVISVDSAGEAGVAGSPSGSMTSLTSSSADSPASSPNLAASQELPSAAGLRKTNSLPPPPPARQRQTRDSGAMPPQSEVQEAIDELAALGGTAAGAELETSGAPAGATVEMSARETAAVRQARGEQRSSSSLPRLRAEDRERPVPPPPLAGPSLPRPAEQPSRLRPSDPTPAIGTPSVSPALGGAPVPPGRRHVTSPLTEQPGVPVAEPAPRVAPPAPRRGVTAATSDGSDERTLTARREALARVANSVALPLRTVSNGEASRIEGVVKEAVEAMQLEGSLGDVEPATVIREVVREATGLGALEELMDDSTVDAIFVNQPHVVLVERLGEAQRTAAHFSGAQGARLALARLASRGGRSLEGDTCEFRLPNGFAVSAALGAAAVEGVAAVFRRVRPTSAGWEDLLRRQMVSPAVVEFLETCVASRRNIVVTGAGGSGKTELLGALASTVPSTERIVSVVAGTGLYLRRDNWVALAQTGHGAGELLRQAFRFGGSRVIVDGCSGPEAFELVTELSGGPCGALVAIAAGSPRHCIDRVTALACTRSGASQEVVERLVGNALHVIVQLVRGADGDSRVAHVVELGTGDRGIELNDIFLLRSDGNGAREGQPFRGQLVATGTVPRFYDEIAALSGKPNTSIFRA
jgi:pilus assembly protein CpaF